MDEIKPLYRGVGGYYLVAVNRRQALEFHKLYPTTTIYLSEKLPETTPTTNLGKEK